MLWQLALVFKTTKPNPETSHFDKSWKATLEYGPLDWNSNTTPDVALQIYYGRQNMPSCMVKYVSRWDRRDPLHPQRPRLCFFPCSEYLNGAQVADGLESRHRI